MKISIAEIKKSGKPVEIEYEEPARTFLPEIELSSSLKVKCSLSFDNNSVSINGKIEALVSLVCTRCLEPYVFNIVRNFKIRYCNLKPRGDMIELESGDMDEEQIPEDGIIDLNEIAREQTLLGIPLKQICKENCLGLCPHCGANLNLEKCKCPQQEGI